MSAARRNEPSAMQWVEESVHLLRRAPIEAFAIYYAGTVPFVLAVLFFWAHTTWFLPSGAEVAWGALGLTLLFILMKALQSEFCAHLSALQFGVPPPAWSWRRIGRVAVAQLELQPWAFVATLVASFVVLPLGWVYAYAQIATVVGSDEQLHRTSVANARLWPWTNHLALSLIAGVAICVWGNLLATFITIPWLASHLLGIDNPFGWSGWDFGNSTFLASVTGVTWLLVDPVVKAFYTLWVFYGRSRRTGDDIRVELQRARLARPVNATRAAALLLVCLAAIATAPARGDGPPPPNVVRAERLDQAISRVLDKPEFSWRLRPLPKPSAESSDGPISRFVREGGRILRDVFRAVGRQIGKFVDWIVDHLFPDRSLHGSPAGAATGMMMLKVLLYAFIGAAILLILWVIWIVFRQAQRQTRSVVAANAVVSAVPDLRDENVQAAQLPTDRWLALAREQMARGEWRLAWRALYLAMLAQLAAEGLISLARFKTNLDYERELRRRALSRAEIVGRFAQRRRGFESVWYGRDIASETDVREWMAELERPVVR